MANNSLSSIRTALNTLLDAVATIQSVAYGRLQTLSGFPACRFYLSGTNDVLVDNKPSYWRTYTFTIELIQEITQKDVATAEEDIQDVVDAVMDTINTNWTLSGDVDLLDIQSSVATEEDFSQGPCVVVRLTLDARTLIT